MLKTLRQICRTGIITEPPPLSDDTLRIADALQSRILEVLGRALCIRAIDAGSCNGCELEIHALNNPLYNIEGLGIRFVASPRHADLLLVTGPVTKKYGSGTAADIRSDAGPEARRCNRRLRLHRRNLRRELCQFGSRLQCNSGRCGGARVPPESSANPQRHSDGHLQGVPEPSSRRSNV